MTDHDSTGSVQDLYGTIKVLPVLAEPHLVLSQLLSTGQDWFHDRTRLLRTGSVSVLRLVNIEMVQS
jgi:hypothetical protein